jgi:hypothetical protein
MKKGRLHLLAILGLLCLTLFVGVLLHRTDDQSPVQEGFYFFKKKKKKHHWKDLNQPCTENCKIINPQNFHISKKLGKDIVRGTAKCPENYRLQKGGEKGKKFRCHLN